MPLSPIRKLTPLANEAKRQGVKVYHLNIGQPDVESPAKAIEAIRSIDRKTLEYSPSDGFPSLRQKLTGYYSKFGIDVKADDILVTAGGSEAILMAFMACLNPGDELLVTEPCYANYITLAVEAGVNVVSVSSKIEDNFALPPIEAFEEAITPLTRGILLCNPSNPTGYVYSPKELLQLKKIVEKYDLFLFSDEVYREFVYTDEPFLSAMALGLENNVVLLDSVSKRYSECGIRVGMIVTKNQAVKDILMKYCQARLSPPLLGQIAAEASIEGVEDYLAAVHDEYKARRDFFIKRLNSIPGVHSPMPHGAFYTVASLPVEDSEDFCRWCLTTFRDKGETVMMAPASGFYRHPGMGRNQVRLAYVLKIEDLARALDILEAALKAYISR